MMNMMKLFLGIPIKQIFNKYIILLKIINLLTKQYTKIKTLKSCNQIKIHTLVGCYNKMNFILRHNQYR